MATILLDVDGCVADFCKPLLEMVTHGRLKPEDVTSWDVFSFMTEGEKKTAFMLLSGPEFWLSQPVIPGASRFVRLARERGHRVVFVTSPWVGCTEWESSRRAWLVERMDADPGDMVFTSAKELVSGDIFIDDRTENVERWIAHNKHNNYAEQGIGTIEERYPFGGLLYDAPYNKCIGLRRFTWDGEGKTIGTDYVLEYLDNLK